MKYCSIFDSRYTSNAELMSGSFKLNVLYCFMLIGVMIPAGCTRMNIVTFSGDCPTSKSKSLYYENDTLLIRYDFWRKDGGMFLTIKNKLNIPISVDWEKSKLVIGKYELKYYDGVDSLQFRANTSSYNPLSNRNSLDLFNGGTTTYGKGIIKRPERISFILPGATDSSGHFNFYPYNPYVKSAVIKPDSSDNQAKRVRFRADNSPLRIRNFLTYTTGDQGITEHYVDQHFWASEFLNVPAHKLRGKLLLQNGDYINVHSKYEAPNAYYYRNESPANTP